MSASDPPAPSLPPRLAWFAPWTSKPWKQRSLLIGDLLPGYVLSPVPVVIAMERTRLSDYPAMDRVFETFYFPILWCAVHWEAVDRFYNALFDVFL